MESVELQGDASPEDDVLRCMNGCGRAYSDFGLDVVLPDDQWARVSGREDGSGVMCAACIVERASKLEGVTVLLAAFDQRGLKERATWSGECQVCATPQVSGGGEIAPRLRLWLQRHELNDGRTTETSELIRDTLAALATPQARPDGGEAVCIVGAMGSVSWRSERILPIGTKLFDHPAPAPDVALVDAATLVMEFYDGQHGEPGVIGCKAAEDLREALAPLIAAQQRTDKS